MRKEKKLCGKIRGEDAGMEAEVSSTLHSHEADS